MRGQKPCDRFAELNLRAACDLLAQVGPLPEGAVVDFGCGAGEAGVALSERFKTRKLVGIESAKPLLKKATATGVYKRCDLVDLSEWEPGKPPALIFSSTALHHVPDHAVLLPRLFNMLAPGGSLAVQMPMQCHASSHVLLRELAARMFPTRFAPETLTATILTPEHYWKMLSPLGQLNLWRSSYYCCLPAEPVAHPVRRFTQNTAMQPFLQELTELEATAFERAYDAALADAYPCASDGSVVMPLMRMFFVLVRPESA
ncbi:trans-aconitate 2-methyltransferase [Rhodobacter aestuarii]|uniref:Trans-aconitate 2-methyltransferase n=1 Tax=Rhodobacter aestuarii TaxID=453582 RepID=A0A1N7Q5T7_9RHOB|nr:methyltransferase domain-containing protein [Rhodobacter aestuarii]PTV93865.1 trans-aconitate 2-methyltransferase [Rhodobacter aestuarii]SIT18250.1 trans-aconitate 2-methyltransferase [Rhodobacter aestuarii]